MQINFGRRQQKLFLNSTMQRKLLCLKKYTQQIFHCLDKKEMNYQELANESCLKTILAYATNCLQKGTCSIGFTAEIVHG